MGPQHEAPHAPPQPHTTSDGSTAPPAPCPTRPNPAPCSGSPSTVPPEPSHGPEPAAPATRMPLGRAAPVGGKSPPRGLGPRLCFSPQAWLSRRSLGGRARPRAFFPPGSSGNTRWREKTMGATSHPPRRVPPFPGRRRASFSFFFFPPPMSIFQISEQSRNSSCPVVGGAGEHRGGAGTPRGSLPQPGLNPLTQHRQNSRTIRVK